MPGAPDDLALARDVIFAGLRRLHERSCHTFAQAAASVRTAIVQCEELTVEIEHHDGAPVHIDQFAVTRRNVGCGRDDMLRHSAASRSPHGAKRNAGLGRTVGSIPDFAALHPGYESPYSVFALPE